MSINYYNSIEDKRFVEQTFSLARKLDQWGTKLVQPRQAAYGGHTYIITRKMIDVVPSSPICRKLTLVEKIKVKVGIILKQIAAFFSAKIKSKYEFVDQLDTLGCLGPKVKPVKNGKSNGIDDCLRPCCH